VLTEEAHSSGVADKTREHEDAAHEKRNWVRLTFDCNDHCVFCLDSETHDGTMRSRDDVKAQILDGRRKGATRLILSGGEPTIHPSYVDFIKLGARAGYGKIQTVTNGRLFSYGDFLKRCLDAGLSEITFSIHGPNARIHDALVGTKGAFEQEITGLRAAVADGRPIVNIDVVVNRANVKQLPEMLRMFIEMGVKEFDLLQVVPFGRAFTDGRDTLFYDLDEMRPYIQEALAFSKRPDVHIWMNRFPPQHLEGYEHLIQDPYKLNDEVRGRKEEFARLLDEGELLACREPSRCKFCYLQKLCDTLEGVIATVDERAFDVVRIDTEWEAAQPAVYGGDPASAKRSLEEAKRRLPIAGVKEKKATTLEALVEAAGATTLRVCAPDVARAVEIIARFPALTLIEIELGDYAGASSLVSTKLARARATTVAQAEQLLAIDAPFEVTIDLTSETAAWLMKRDGDWSRVALLQPTYERLTENAERDVDLRTFFQSFTRDVPLDGIPACVSGRVPRARPRMLDTAMMTPDARLEIFRYARRYILEGYLTKSLRCSDCVHTATCDGMHVSYVRAHGYSVMDPVRG
jgi:molybdenum cofactor biosynthesis enzyme MoaA